MKVLVTGATGFLGGHLCELLVQQGHKVRALTRSTSDTTLLDTLGIECVEANLERGLGLDKAIEGMDAVVHGAAVVKAKSPQVFHEVNCGGTEHLLQAALRKRDALQRFVFVSSLAAHGASRDGSPRPVDAPAHPVTHYGRSKLAAERMVIEAQDALPVTVIRPPAIYGPRDQEMLSFFKMIDSRLIAFLGSPRNTISLIWGPDCARAIC
ncbi:MAG: NAD-dependent epimerase/dehydratase family protein, partial [Myxococcota bacterium]